MRTDLQPYISIIIATLNASSTLEKCLNSISNQTYTNYELIIIDGGSSDGSQDITHKYSHLVSYFVSEPDTGIYNAWNKGLIHSSGQWICFLGADDFFWDENVLKELSTYMRLATKKEIRIVHGQVARVNDDYKIMALWGKHWKKNRWQMPHGMPLGLPHTGLMHHTNLFKDHGPFDDSFKLAGDYEFLLRELINKNSGTLYAENLLTVGQLIGGAVDSNKSEFHREVSFARQKNRLPKFSWLWWAVKIRNSLRRYLQKL